MRRRGGSSRSTCVTAAAAGACALIALVGLIRYEYAEDDGCARISDIEQQSEEHLKPAGLRAHRVAEFLAFVRQAEPTLSEIMGFESGFRRPSRNESAPVTVVLNHFKRRTLCAQLEALLGQTAVPSHIWVVLFGSPVAERLERVARSYADQRTSISVVTSDLNLKYYGRMQVAARAPTEFVLVIDDDMIPGARYVEQMLHAAQTRPFSRALLGSIGWILPRPSHDGSFGSYRDLNGSGGVYLPDQPYGIQVERAVETDFLCSLWFVRTKWLAMLFREQPSTWETSEDFQLSYLLRKYAGVRSVVMPVDADDPTTWADTAHKLAWVGATTTGPGAKAASSGSNTPTRDRAWWLGLTRGGSQRGVRERPPPQREQVVLLVSSERDAAALRPLYHGFLRRSGPSLFRRPLVVLAAPEGRCVALAAALGLGAAACDASVRNLRLLDLGLGRGVLGGAARAADVFDEILGDLSGLLAALEPEVVIHALGSGHGPAAAEEPAHRAGAHVAPADALSAALGRPRPLGDSERAHVAARAVAAACHAARTPLIALPTAEAASAAWLSHLAPKTLARWHEPQFTLIVSGTDAAALTATLDGARALHTLGDRVALRLRVSSELSTEMKKLVRSVRWEHGPLIGVQPLRDYTSTVAFEAEAWYPASEHSYGLALREGDSISAYAYAWLKYCVLRYRYDPASSISDQSFGLLGVGLAPVHALAAPPAEDDEARGEGPPVRLDHALEAEPLLLFPESRTELHESASRELKAKADARALAAAAEGGSAWRSILEGMTGKGFGAAGDDEPDSASWREHMRSLARQPGRPSALLRPHMRDRHGALACFVEPAGGAKAVGRMPKEIPFTAAWTSALPDVPQIPRVR